MLWLQNEMTGRYRDKQLHPLREDEKL